MGNDEAVVVVMGRTWKDKGMGEEGRGMEWEEEKEECLHLLFMLLLLLFFFFLLLLLLLTTLALLYSIILVPCPSLFSPSFCDGQSWGGRKGGGR